MCHLLELKNMNNYLKTVDENGSGVDSSTLKCLIKIIHFLNTYIDQSEVVFIDWKLLWTDVFFQSRGIGALKEKNNKSSVVCKIDKVKRYLRDHLKQASPLAAPVFGGHAERKGVRSKPAVDPLIQLSRPRTCSSWPQ